MWVITRFYLSMYCSINTWIHEPNPPNKHVHVYVCTPYVILLAVCHVRLTNSFIYTSNTYTYIHFLSQPSYVFCDRSVTPAPYHSQMKYCGELDSQVVMKHTRRYIEREEEEKTGREEQERLAKELVKTIPSIHWLSTLSRASGWCISEPMSIFYMRHAHLFENTCSCYVICLYL